MQAYAACDDPEIRAVVRNGFGDLVSYVERVSGAEPRSIARFFAKRDADERPRLDGTLDEPTEPWAQRLLAGCKDKLEPSFFRLG